MIKSFSWVHAQNGRDNSLTQTHTEKAIVDSDEQTQYLPVEPSIVPVRLQRDQVARVPNITFLQYEWLSVSKEILKVSPFEMGRSVESSESVGHAEELACPTVSRWLESPWRLSHRIGPAYFEFGPSRFCVSHCMRHRSLCTPGCVGYSFCLSRPSSIAESQGLGAGLASGE